MNKVSVLIPFLNESESITTLVSELNEFYKENNNKIQEFIFIDDGSTDNSVDLLKSQNSTLPFTIIKLSKNFGSHAALRAGIRQAKGAYITFIYADLQDPLSLILELKKEIIKGNNIIWGQRKKTQSGLFSVLYSKLIQRYVNPKYPSQGFDVVMFDEKVKNELNKHIEANSSIFLQILNFGFKQASIKYEKQERVKGKSKWTLSKKIKLFIDSFVAFSYLPIRLVSISGLIMFLIGTIWALYLISRKLMLNDLDSGWPALISILTIGFGITNISLGIIAEYLWRTLDVSRKRPVFIIDEIIELKKTNGE